MTEKTRQKAIEILSSGDPIVCTGLVEKFVWANTTQPKYKVGDVVQFTNPSTGILRHKRAEDGGRKTERKSVIWAIGKVIDVRMLINDRTFQYEVEYETDLEGWDVAGKSITSHSAFPLEHHLHPADAYRPTLWSELSGK